MKQSNFLIIGFSLLAVIFSISAYLHSGGLKFAEDKLGAFPTHVSSGDTITSSDWNLMTDATIRDDTAPIIFRGSDGNISISTSSASVSGFLTTTDWNTFNNKQATITDGTNLTFTGATLNVDDPFSVTKLTATNASTTYATLPTFWGTNGTITNATSTTSQFIPAIAGLTLSASGQIGIDTTSGNYKFRNDNGTQVLTATSSFSFVIASTTASEFIQLKTFSQASTISKTSCVNSDEGSPSITFNLAHGTNLKSTATLFSPSAVNTSTTTPTAYYSFNDNTLAAGEIMVATTSASTGTGIFQCSVYYKLD